MPRDTLVFRAGVLARTALSLAFGVPHMHAVYAAWLCSAGGEASEGGPTPDPQAMQAMQAIMEAGLESGGRLRLLARKRPTEFVVIFEHERFTATVCVAYEPSRERIDGLHLAHFEGHGHSALEWFDTAAHELGRGLERAQQRQRALGAVRKPPSGMN